MRVIRRYSNRRLYDSQTSRTIKHEDLAELIRNGERFQIVDSVSGEDITSEVLGRLAFAEAAKGADSTETRDFFAWIIESGGEKTMSVLKNTVLASIGAFEVSKARAEKIVDELIRRGEVEKGEKTEAVMELLDKAEKSTAKAYGKVVEEVKKVQQEVSKYTTQAQQYKVVKKEDIATLEAKVDRLTELVQSLEAKLNGGQPHQE